jgi:anti-anti-sigma factor
MMNETPPGQWLERTDFGDMTVLRVKVPMFRDDETTEALFEHAFSLVDTVGRSRLVLNLDGVGFIASAAIGKLILLMRKTASAGGKLTLCKLSRQLEQVIQVCRLSDVLLNYEDEQEALQALIAHGGRSC